jgi:hypothetical protein
VELQAAFTGDLLLSLGTDDGKLLPFTVWLSATISVLSPNSTGHRPDFMTAGATFNGSFAAEVTPGAPFADLITTPFPVNGFFVTPYVLNFFNISASGKPNVTLDVNLPNFGDVRNLSFRDVVRILGDALEFLIGDEDVESCKAGLLGLDVFTYQIPGECGCSQVLSFTIWCQVKTNLKLSPLFVQFWASLCAAQRAFCKL